VIEDRDQIPLKRLFVSITDVAAAVDSAFPFIPSSVHHRSSSSHFASHCRASGHPQSNTRSEVLLRRPPSGGRWVRLPARLAISSGSVPLVSSFHHCWFVCSTIDSIRRRSSSLIALRAGGRHRAEALPAKHPFESILKILKRVDLCLPME
jgi:hypothetical protein